MPTCPTRERGGILLELIIAAFILATFTSGAARVHSSLRARFDRILSAREEGIRAARH